MDQSSGDATGPAAPIGTPGGEFCDGTYYQQRRDGRPGRLAVVWGFLRGESRNQRLAVLKLVIPFIRRIKGIDYDHLARTSTFRGFVRLLWIMRK
jgi:hypothetical protein